MEDLSKIDEIRRRFGISYREAQEALEHTDGDIVAALINLEAKQEHEGCNCQKGPEMWGKVKKQFVGTHKKRIVISKEGKTVANIPASYGAVGLVGLLLNAELAVIAGVGALAALASDYRFKIDSGQDQEENSNEH